MKILSLIMNLVACTLSNLLGTGLKACTFDFRTPSVVILLEKGYKILAGDIPNLAYFKILQQKGKCIILNGVVDFKDDTPADDLGKRASTGKEYLTLKHPYKWTFTFNNGLYFYKAMCALESNNRYDVILLDSKGDMLLSQDKQGNGRGLDLGILNNGKYMIGNDNENSMTVQIDRLDFDQNVSWIKAENLDFSPSDIDGINDINIQIDATAPGTSLVFTPKLSDMNHLLEGLVVTNLRVKKNGATITPTAISYITNAGKVTLTVGALIATDVVTVELWDNSVPSGVINQSGDLYKSNVATVTVA